MKYPSWKLCFKFSFICLPDVFNQKYYISNQVLFLFTREDVRIYIFPKIIIFSFKNIDWFCGSEFTFISKSTWFGFASTWKLIKKGRWWECSYRKAVGLLKANFYLLWTVLFLTVKKKNQTKRKQKGILWWMFGLCES